MCEKYRAYKEKQIGQISGLVKARVWEEVNVWKTKE